MQVFFRAGAPQRRESSPAAARPRDYFFLSDSGFQFAPDLSEPETAGPSLAFLSAFGLRFSLLLFCCPLATSPSFAMVRKASLAHSGHRPVNSRA